MKTITIWNVPVDVAEKIAGMLREKAGDMLKEGQSTEEVQKLMYTIDNLENDLKEITEE